LIVSNIHKFYEAKDVQLKYHAETHEQTIWIYLGIAGLIGLATGAVLHLTFNLISSTLRIDSVAEAERKARFNGRTPAQFRAARRKKHAALESQSPDYPSTPTMVNKGFGSRRQRGLLSQTIMEEQDSDF
jgi:hypothetical protein